MNLSGGAAPGIFKMYMGSVKQLKKSSKMLPIQKNLGLNPSHMISLNADASAN